MNTQALMRALLAGHPRMMRGNPLNAALAQPWVGPPLFGDDGIPLGFDLKTRRLITLDLWQLVQMDLIHSAVVMILGQKRCGKSALQKSYAGRAAMWQAGPQKAMRIWFNDRKPEKGDGEYAALTRFLGAEPIPLTDASVNPLEHSMGLAPADDLQILLAMLENVPEFDLGGWRKLVAQVALFRMLQTSEQYASLGTYEYITRTLGGGDLADYYRNCDETQIFGEQPALARQHLIRATPDQLHNIPVHEFERDAAQLAQAMGWLMNGPYGRAFGGKRSMNDLFTGQVVSKDWTGVSNDLQTIFATIFRMWQNVALATNAMQRVPNLDIADEQFEDITNPALARALAIYIKKIRAYPTALLRATQFFTDLTEAGAEGSEIRGLARGMLEGTGLFIIGNLPHKTWVIEELVGLGMTEADADFTTKLPRGAFAILAPNHAPVFYQHVLLDIELPLTKTGAAGEDLLQRAPSIMTPEEVLRLAAEMGVVPLSAILEGV
jgi:hypothetical protein